jgi:hypothetical protein
MSHACEPPYNGVRMNIHAQVMAMNAMRETALNAARERGVIAVRKANELARVDGLTRARGDE